MLVKSLIVFLFYFGLGHVALGSVSPKVDSGLEAYQKGLRLYQEANYEEALGLFKAFVREEPNNIPALYNMGLSAYQAAKRGLAVGAWRRALFFDPGFKPARQALELARSEMPREAFQGPRGYRGFLETHILSVTTLIQHISLNVLLLLGCGIILIRYFAKRANALATDQSLPPFPFFGSFLSLLFFLSLILVLQKAHWDKAPRATVISKNLNLYSGPSSQQNILFDLSEGFQVVIRQTQGEWAQVTYPGGLTGWTYKEQLFQTTGAPRW